MKKQPITLKHQDSALIYNELNGGNTDILQCS